MINIKEVGKMEKNNEPIEVVVSCEGYPRAKFVFDNKIIQTKEEPEDTIIAFKMELERSDGTIRSVQCLSNDHKGLIQLHGLLRHFYDVHIKTRGDFKRKLIAADESLSVPMSQTENQGW